jgi:hypothetical protein
MRIVRLVSVVRVSVALGLLAEPSIAPAQSLTGRVTIDSTANPVIGAAVSLLGSAISTRTDSSGRYFLRPVPSGAQVIQVQQIGYVALQKSVSVSESGVTTADFRLPRPLTRLDTLKVMGENWMHKPERLSNTTKYDEFYGRKTISAGGVQLTHEELEKRVNARLEEALTSIPGVTINRRGSRSGIQLGTCPQKRVAVYVDGHKEYPINPPTGPLFAMPAKAPPVIDDGPLDVLNQFDLRTVEAMEVYRSIDGMPAEARGDACAAIYIWTR